MTGKSSMNESIPLVGHPHVGCAIICKTNIKCDIRKVKCSHQRLCGVCLTVNNDILLILNAYMPGDTNRQDVHFIEFMEVMSEVDQLIQQLNPSRCIFDGDPNTDLERSSPQTAALKQFISDYNFIACVDLDIDEVPYSCISPNSTSKIDHFIVPPAIGDCILS